MRRRTLQPLGYSSAMTAGAARRDRLSPRREEPACGAKARGAARALVGRPAIRKAQQHFFRASESRVVVAAYISRRYGPRPSRGRWSCCWLRAARLFGGNVDQDTNTDTSRLRDVHLPGIEQKNPNNKRCQFFKRHPSPPCRCCRRCRCSPSRPPQSNRTARLAAVGRIKSNNYRKWIDQSKCPWMWRPSMRTCTTSRKWRRGRTYT
jgi:hypothetical protein